jgi:hypothetical protein
MPHRYGVEIEAHDVPEAVDAGFVHHVVTSVTPQQAGMEQQRIERVADTLACPVVAVVPVPDFLAVSTTVRAQAQVQLGAAVDLPFGQIEPDDRVAPGPVPAVLGGQVGEQRAVGFEQLLEGVMALLAEFSQVLDADGESAARLLGP